MRTHIFVTWSDLIHSSNKRVATSHDLRLTMYCAIQCPSSKNTGQEVSQNLPCALSKLRDATLRQSPTENYY